MVRSLYLAMLCSSGAFWQPVYSQHSPPCFPLAVDLRLMLPALCFLLRAFVTYMMANFYTSNSSMLAAMLKVAITRYFPGPQAQMLVSTAQK